jgi:hypothetical protein
MKRIAFSRLDLSDHFVPAHGSLDRITNRQN